VFLPSSAILHKILTPLVRPLQTSLGLIKITSRSQSHIIFICIIIIAINTYSVYEEKEELFFLVSDFTYDDLVKGTTITLDASIISERDAETPLELAAFAIDMMINSKKPKVNKILLLEQLPLCDTVLMDFPSSYWKP